MKTALANLPHPRNHVNPTRNSGITTATQARGPGLGCDFGILLVR